MDLKETGILGEAVGTHWYYRSKAAAMQRLLGDAPIRAVLDIGAGSGYFSQVLLAQTAAREAWCVDTSYPADSTAQVSGKPMHFRRAVETVDADVALLMDVLEHVDDDAGLLAAYAAKVPAGCRFLITVPAFQFLWSPHDEFLGHRRRYTLASLEATVSAAGLRVRSGLYYFGFVLPFAAAVRVAANATGRGRPARSHLRRHGPVTNRLLTALCSAERPFMRANRLAGLSVFCLAETR
jgi:SAM-dependent methyltransferase